MQGFYSFEYEDGVHDVTLEIKDTETGKFKVISRAPISPPRLRQRPGYAPFAQLCWNSTKNKSQGQAEIASVLSLDVSELSKKKTEKFLASLINRVQCNSYFFIEGKDDLEEFIAENYPG